MRRYAHKNEALRTKVKTKVWIKKWYETLALNQSLQPSESKLNKLVKLQSNWVHRGNNVSFHSDSRMGNILWCSWCYTNITFPTLFTAVWVDIIYSDSMAPLSRSTLYSHAEMLQTKSPILLCIAQAAANNQSDLLPFFLNWIMIVSYQPGISKTNPLTHVIPLSIDLSTGTVSLAQLSLHRSR